MLKINYLLLLVFVFSSCNNFFAVKDTTHTVTVTNHSDYNLELVWSFGETEGNQEIDVNETNKRSGSVLFLSEGGDKNALDENEVYKRFESINLIVQMNDGSQLKIPMESLNIRPDIKNDDFMSTSNWVYHYDIYNENLEVLIDD